MVYNSFVSKGYNLIKSLGTFINKYYPFRVFVANVLQAHENIAEQNEQTLNEVKVYDSVHIEKLYPINLDTQACFFKAGITGFLAGEPYRWVSGIVSNDAQYYSYAIDSNIESIERLSTTILGSDSIQDYAVAFGRLLLKNDPNQKTIWGWNVKFKPQERSNIWGLSSAQDEVLTKIAKYGLTKTRLKSYVAITCGFPYIRSTEETVTSIDFNIITTDKNQYTILRGPANVTVGETYSKYWLLDNSVEVLNYLNDEIYTLEGLVNIHEDVKIEMKFGSFTFGEGKFGEAYHYKDIYIKPGLVMYTVKIYNPVSTKKAELAYLNRYVPVWMNMDLQCIYSAYSQELYEEFSDSNETIKAYIKSEKYDHFAQGVFEKPIFGYVTFDEFTFGKLLEQDKVRTIRQYK